MQLSLPRSSVMTRVFWGIWILGLCFVGYAASQSFVFTTWFAPTWIFLPLLFINAEQVYICIRRSQEVSADRAKYNTVTFLGHYKKRNSSVTSPPTDDSIEEQQDMCVICLTNFEPGDSIRKLPCSHVYHRGCIDDYFNRQVRVAYNSQQGGIDEEGGVLPPRHPLCAVCRRDILHPDAPGPHH